MEENYRWWMIREGKGSQRVYSLYNGKRLQFQIKNVRVAEKVLFKTLGLHPREKDYDGDKVVMGLILVKK